MSTGRELLMRAPRTQQAPSEDELETNVMRERNRLAAELVAMFRDAMMQARREMVEAVRLMPQIPHRKPSGWLLKVHRVDGLIDSFEITPKD